MGGNSLQMDLSCSWTSPSNQELLFSTLKLLQFLFLHDRFILNIIWGRRCLHNNIFLPLQDNHNFTTTNAHSQMYRKQNSCIPPISSIPLNKMFGSYQTSRTDEKRWLQTYETVILVHNKSLKKLFLKFFLYVHVFSYYFLFTQLPLFLSIIMLL